MNLSYVKTKDYRNEPCLRSPAKQSQSNPISIPWIIKHAVDGKVPSAGIFGEYLVIGR